MHPIQVDDDRDDGDCRDDCDRRDDGDRDDVRAIRYPHRHHRHRTNGDDDVYVLKDRRDAVAMLPTWPACWMHTK